MRNKVRRIVENGYVAWLGAVFLLVLVFSGKTANIIGSSFPVITPLEITSIEPATGQSFPSSLIKGTATKLRNCDQRSVNWYISDGTNEGTVFSIFLDEPQSRDVGPLEFKGIVVGLPPERVKFSRAEVSHDCFGGWVSVISEFYTGDKVK